jgi:hypothetical protein
MAISSELIGSLRGNYLFAWQGNLTAVFASGSSVLINGQTLVDLPTNNNSGMPVGGFVVLYNVATIALTGVGTKRFVEDPYAAFVRVK